MLDLCLSVVCIFHLEVNKKDAQDVLFIYEVESPDNCPPLNNQVFSLKFKC